MAESTEQTPGAGSKESSVEKKPAPADGLKFRNEVDGSLNAKVPWILEGLIAEREQMLVFGAPKVGKSQFALQLAVAVALGKPFLKWTNNGGRPRKVIYVNFEIDEHPFMNRLADHVLAEVDPGWSRNPDVPELGSESIERVNAAINGCFYYSDGIRSLGLTEKMLKTGRGHHHEKNDSKEKKIPLVEEWRAKITSLEPDLIVFDTLSKMHTIDERENSPIQQVMMMIRRIATTTTAEGESNGRAVAHVVVHHARKGSGDYSANATPSLDSIRGGSAIRAESDVILGLGSGKAMKKGGAAVRKMVLEARNIAGEEGILLFNGTRFAPGSPADVVSNQFVPDSTVMKPFLRYGVRGIGVGRLCKLITGNEDERVQENVTMRTAIETLAKQGILEIVKGGRRKTLYAQHKPVMHESARGSRLVCWIPDGSGWLELPEVQEALVIRKGDEPAVEVIKESKRGRGRPRKTPGGQKRTRSKRRKKIRRKKKIITTTTPSP